METDVLNNIEKEARQNTNSFVLDSLGPVESVEEMEEDVPDKELVIYLIFFYIFFNLRENPSLTLRFSTSNFDKILSPFDK